MTMIYPDIEQHKALIQEQLGGGWQAPEETRQYLSDYFSVYAVDMATLTTYKQVNRAIDYCQRSPMLYHLKQIHKLPNGGYSIAPGSMAYISNYLQPFGYRLDRLTNYKELLEALGLCNSVEFQGLLQKPAPTQALRFVWQRLRNLRHTVLKV